MEMSDSFQRQKRQCLDAVDLSRKGSVDLPIIDLVNEINTRDAYFTRSSCSGRIAVIENIDNGQLKKAGCKWLYMSHEEADPNTVVDSLKDLVGTAVLKFEPFVLHVQCRTLSDAQLMLADAVASGFRNSGISIGKKEKIILAVRSTHGLEVPLSSAGTLLVTKQYIHFCIELANSKLEENFNRIRRFKHLYISMLEERKEKLGKRHCCNTTRDGIEKSVWHSEQRLSPTVHTSTTETLDVVKKVERVKLEDGTTSPLFSNI